MKSKTVDPWGSNTSDLSHCDAITSFEDSFVTVETDSSRRLSDSDQYLQRLYSRLRNIQGGTSKKDLVNSLSQMKEDTIARLITTGARLDSEDEVILTTNPVLRHITPHLQAMTASELIHLLKADILEAVTAEQQDDNNEEDNSIQVSAQTPSVN